MDPYRWTFRQIVWATLVLVFVALSFWLLYRFRQIVFILFIAIVLATVIRPAVAWFHRRGLPRIAGVIFVYFLLLSLIIGFLLLLSPLIFEQGTTIAAAIPAYYESLRVWMMNAPNQLIVRIGEVMPQTISGLAGIQPAEGQGMTSAAQALIYLKSVGNILISVSAVLLLAFHWTLDGPRIIKSLMLLVPTGQREDISELVSAMEAKVGSYIAGQGVLCLVIGAMALVVYTLIGLPNALVLALMAGVLEAVPMVGPLLGAIPAAVIAVSIAPSKLVWVIVATLVIQQLENNLLVPRVMRKAVGVNPFVSLLAIFAFSSLFGVIGAFMAIPIAAILQLLLDRFVFHPSVLEPEVSAGRDYASRLRYEVQDLAQDLRKQARLKQEGSETMVKQSDQLLDEVETITTDLDALLAQLPAAIAT